MKFTFIITFIVLASLSTELFAEGGTGVGNGGDTYALEFQAMAKAAVKEIKLSDLEFASEDMEKIQKKIRSTKVVSRKKSIKVDGIKVFAIVSESQELGVHIILSRKQWRQIKASLMRKIKALETYITLMDLGERGKQLISDYLVQHFPQLEIPTMSADVSCRAQYQIWYPIAHKRSILKRTILGSATIAGLIATTIVIWPSWPLIGSLLANSPTGIIIGASLSEKTNYCARGIIRGTRSGLEKAYDVVSWAMNPKAQLNTMPSVLNSVFKDLYMQERIEQPEELRRANARIQYKAYDLKQQIRDIIISGTQSSDFCNGAKPMTIVEIKKYLRARF